MTRTVTVFAASGTAGQACVNELLEHADFEVRILRRKPGQEEKSSSGITLSTDEKQTMWDDWSRRGAEPCSRRQSKVTRTSASHFWHWNRNPGASGKIMTPMIIGLALIESLVIYALVISFMLLGKF